MVASIDFINIELEFKGITDVTKNKVFRDILILVYLIIT